MESDIFLNDKLQSESNHKLLITFDLETKSEIIENDNFIFGEIKYKVQETPIQEIDIKKQKSKNKNKIF